MAQILVDISVPSPNEFFLTEATIESNEIINSSHYILVLFSITTEDDKYRSFQTEYS